MSIKLPPVAAGSIQPEYAASNIALNRNPRLVAGGYVGLFSGSLSYSRIDYLVDGEGKKTAMLAPDAQASADAARYGNLYINEDQLLEDLAANPVLAAALETIADYLDGKIHADLVARAIIPS